MKRTLLLIVAVAAACGTKNAAPAASGGEAAPAETSAPGAPAAPATPAAPAAPVAKGTVATHSFSSAALGVVKAYVVYLPAGYADADSAAKRYPVVYLLHGIGGDETNWNDYGKLAAAADALGLRAIVVMPDGDSGFYVNGALPVDFDGCMNKQRGHFGRVREPKTFCVKAPRYEDYVTKDLIGHIDATYRTVPERRARAVSGLSMGGFGALVLAMRHPDLFVSTASHSGVDALLYEGPYPYDAKKVVLVEDAKKWGAKSDGFGAWIRSVFGGDIANWRAHDPALLAAKLTPGALAIYLDVGTADDFGLNAGAEYLHDVLTKRGIEHAWTLVEGGRHNFSLWSQRIDDSLAFHAAVFAKSGL